MSAQQKLPTRQLGKNGPAVSAIGLGAMGMGAFYGASDDNESMKTLTYAADRGMTFWDTADGYGTSQTLLGRWFKETGRRKEIFLATKFGARKLDGKTEQERTNPCSQPAYIRQQLKNSLEALQTDYIDLYYQHRVDPKVPIEVVLETLREFVESGQVKWIGLSEPSVATLRRAKAVPVVGEKVVAAQMEFSPFEIDIEKTGFVDAINELGMAVVAYSPLARGLVTGRFRSRADFEEGDFRLTVPRFSEENFPKNLAIADKLKVFADKYNATPVQITIAWILAEYPNFVPIPGIRTVDRLEDNAKGAEIKLSPEDVKAIRQLVESADVAGDRYARIPAGDCISKEEWKGE